MPGSINGARQPLPQTGNMQGTMNEIAALANTLNAAGVPVNSLITNALGGGAPQPGAQAQPGAAAQPGATGARPVTGAPAPTGGSPNSANLQQAINQGYQMTFDAQTLPGGIRSLASLSQLRQQRLAYVSALVSANANASGGLDQLALARLNMENANATAMNDLAKKLQDTQQAVIQTWTRS